MDEQTPSEWARDAREWRGRIRVFSEPIPEPRGSFTCVRCGREWYHWRDKPPRICPPCDRDRGLPKPEAQALVRHMDDEGWTGGEIYRWWRGGYAVRLPHPTNAFPPFLSREQFDRFKARIESD